MLDDLDCKDCKELLLPAIPEPKHPGGRPKHLIVQEFDEDPAAIIERLTECHGDIEVFCQSYHCPLVAKRNFLARIYFLLNQPGNESYLRDWELLVTCYKQAVTTVAEREALSFVTNMKAPDPEKTPLKDMIAYTNLWLTDIKEAARQKAKRPIDKGDAAAVAQVKQMLEQMKAGSE